MCTARERERWAVPPMTGTVNSIDLSMLDPADPDDRWLLIEADHPMLQQPLLDGLDEIVLDGHVMKPSSAHRPARGRGGTAVG